MYDGKLRIGINENDDGNDEQRRGIGGVVS
jgi:hypothetical protein